ncbi:TIGR03086 family metal-binding protein [Actinocrispum wychmicini]|uniref:Uncharacterized protein (TIGR03086 family) n=1 Tax=Actinocrispum wychmicini TaxID=1213861 RepID=A0A4R2K4P2_9PSEU|nr:TIGR03086 family metal-binding protein [Actinocrispum wychmicini]TCO64779.1 uncharacterized protein (TIGR03086 family) [Actinocrispum wychmicini]
MPELIELATGPVLDVVRRIEPDQLAAPTPCAEFDVRTLLNHLLYWGPSLEGAARKVLVAPPETAEKDTALPADWQPKLLAHLAKLTESWRDPSAWEGVTQMGTPTELPAILVGGMVVGEVVVHGWDLATATGRTPVWADELLTYVHKEVVENVQWGRDMGVYGPEVPVPEDAPLLARILGLTGRNPAQ